MSVEEPERFMRIGWAGALLGVAGGSSASLQLSQRPRAKPCASTQHSACAPSVTLQRGIGYHVEYDTPTSGRASGHQSRITSNDPNAEIILLIVP